MIRMRHTKGALQAAFGSWFVSAIIEKQERNEKKVQSAFGSTAKSAAAAKHGGAARGFRASCRLRRGPLRRPSLQRP